MVGQTGHFSFGDATGQKEKNCQRNVIQRISSTVALHSSVSSLSKKCSAFSARLHTYKQMWRWEVYMCVCIETKRPFLVTIFNFNKKLYIYIYIYNKRENTKATVHPRLKFGHDCIDEKMGFQLLLTLCLRHCKIDIYALSPVLSTLYS